MKKGLCLLAVALLAAALSGCGETRAPAKSELPKQSGEKEPLAGGWQDADGEISDKEREIFAAAVKTDGRSLVPEKMLATQVVAGINYKFLCREEETGKEYIAVVYHDLKGNSSFLSVTECS